MKKLIRYRVEAEEKLAAQWRTKKLVGCRGEAEKKLAAQWTTKKWMAQMTAVECKKLVAETL